MNKKYIIVLSVLGGLLGVSLLVWVSYAYYMVSVSQINKNIVKSSCLDLEELEGSTLASKYIMTMVNGKAYVNMANMASLRSTDNYYANSVESRVLATGSLGPNASINYSLRLWMDEATPMTTDAINKSFRSRVVVVATSTKSVDFDYTGTE